MLHYVYADQLDQMPLLRDTMFRDRAAQFKTRLGWDVRVDDKGFERDEYDDMNPLYVIWQNANGTHGGSMRFLPTTAECMVNDHFSDMLDGGTICSPLIWECTRFCLSQNSDRKTAAALVLGAGEVMERFSLDHFVGVFDPRMERIYRLYGVQPDVIATSGEGANEIGVGLWEMQAEAWPNILARVGVDRDVSKEWMAASLFRPRDLAISAAA